MTRLRWEGEARDVEVRGSGEALRVLVDGREFQPLVQQVSPGTFLLREGDRREVFHCVRDGKVIHLCFQGETYRLVEDAEGEALTLRHSSGGLEAPMPGRVVKVNVAPGQAVSKGEEILVVEAMKMENAIRAPRDGTVRSVSARVGDLVAPGLVLVELE